MPSESLALFQEIGHEVWGLISIPIIPYRPYYTFLKNSIYKLCAGTHVDRIYIIIL